MPTPEWLINNGLGVFFAVALLWIIDRRLGAVSRALEKLTLQVALMLDRSARATEVAAKASENAAHAAQQAVEQQHPT